MIAMPRMMSLMLLLVGLSLISGCDAGPSGPSAASRAVGSTTDAVEPGTSGRVRGVMLYADSSTKGAYAVKLETPQGKRVYYFDPPERPALSRIGYIVGRPYVVEYKADATGQSDGLATRIEPAGNANADVTSAIDTVCQFYNNIYFFKLDTAWALLSTRAQSKTSRSEFKLEWPGDELTQSIVWNADFKPRRIELEQHDKDQVVLLVDVTRLFKAGHSQVRRVTLVQEGSAWRIDNVTTGSLDDFL
ncbi:MAG: hypothetical protein ACYCW6_24960 [Candidatus Xenobia bacterium]